MKIVKVNLGSGPNGIEGWENLDWGILPLLGKVELVRSVFIKFKLLPGYYNIKWPKIRLFDIRRSLPYKNNEVNFVYCSHVLEHFEKWETKKILKEIKRILKKNGVARIILPDLEIITDKYSGAEIFCREFYGFDKDKKWGIVGKFIRGHQWMYDKKSLKKLLLEVGFQKIVIRKFGEGICPDLKKLDYPPHKESSMYIEAQ